MNKKVITLVLAVLVGTILVLALYWRVKWVMVFGKDGRIAEGFIWRTRSEDWKIFISRDARLKIVFISCGEIEDWAFTCLDRSGQMWAIEFMNKRIEK